MSAHKLLAYTSTQAKRRRRSQRTTKELFPFPDVFPVEVVREIVDATLHQIWEVSDKMRDPKFSDVLSLMRVGLRLLQTLPASASWLGVSSSQSTTGIQVDGFGSRRYEREKSWQMNTWKEHLAFVPSLLSTIPGPSINT